MDKVLEKKIHSSLKENLSSIKKLFAKPVEDQQKLEKQALLEDIEKAISDIRYARLCFEDAKSPEMIEACIYEIKSAEARYSFLLRKAKLAAERENIPSLPLAK